VHNKASRRRSEEKPSVFILDVDGVMTDGKFYYSADGKLMKCFGPDDHDALNLLKPLIEIRFVSGDKNGFPITRKRIEEDMKYPLDLVSTIHRREWIAERYDLKKVIYMGDGIFDGLVFDSVCYGIAPSGSSPLALEYADFVTASPGGNRAVTEACLHLMELFFEPFKLDTVAELGLEQLGAWKA